MVEAHVLDRLSSAAQRKRWFVGLTVGARCRQIRAALVGAEGTGLASRAEVFAATRSAVSPGVTHQFERLRRNYGGSPVEAALLAAQLAECQASLLDDFASQIAPVWDRILTVAVEDPGLWRHAGGLTGYVGLCDAARLAELSGQNVVDAFAARDLAQDGRGRPLLGIPTWMLLRDLQKTRLLIESGRSVRVWILPASRDVSGAGRIQTFSVETRDPQSTQQSASDDTTLADEVARQLMADLTQFPKVDEILFDGANRQNIALANALAKQLPDVPLVDVAALGLPGGSLMPAAVALLGLLHVDQVPANSTVLTGARVPRVLGRLTPGTLANWHRLMRELAAARPSVVALRSAV